MKTERRPDFDALRVLATLAVFLFHCAKFFDSGGWHLTNRPTSPFFSGMVEWVALWLMPLFFVLSGASTRLALNSRSTSQLVRDRVLRLMLPFAFGVLVIVAPQVWVERVGHGDFHGTLWQFYPSHYFEGWYGRGGNFAWMGLHLWYLGLLFFITLLWAPVLGPMTRGGGARLVSRVQTFLATGAGLLALVAVCWAVEVALIDRRLDFRGLGGWSPVQYALFFFAGMVVPQHEGLRARLVRVAVPALVCGLAVGAIYAFTPVESFHHVPRAMRRLFRATGSWGVLLGMLGCADRWLRHGRWIAPLNEASLPFYIFHQTVILLFALWLLSWEIAPGVKYIVLATLAFLTTTGLTAAVVRAPWVRPLFGLKLERQRA